MAFRISGFGRPDVHPTSLPHCELLGEGKDKPAAGGEFLMEERHFRAAVPKVHFRHWGEAAAAESPANGETAAKSCAEIKVPICDLSVGFFHYGEAGWDYLRYTWVAGYRFEKSWSGLKAKP
jgi:hypothetical protein